MSALHDFLDAMRQRGLDPVEDIVADGQLHRVRWAGDKNGSRNGAYVLHLDGHPAGFVECFKRGIRFTWSAKGARLDPAERKAFAAQMAAERKRRQQEERERHALAAKQARAIIDASATPDPGHSYLESKGIEPHGLTVDNAGRLIVPLRDAKGTVWSIQTIAQDGTKLFLAGGRKKGLFHMIGEPGDDVVIAEGFATAASIREATGLPVVVAFDAGNLGPACKAVREWMPLARIVIAADDDHGIDGNPGVTKAQEAAELISAAVAVPAFRDGEQRGTDFNDLAALRGHEPVAEIIKAAFASSTALEDEHEPDFATADGAAQTTDDWEAPLLEAVEELNAKHFVVTVGGQTVIATMSRDDAQGRDLLVFSQDRDIRLRYRHRHFVTGHTAKGLPIRKGLGDAWLDHRDRRTFERLALIPSGPCPPDTYNLWRGFGVEPKAGSWARIRQHLLEVVCAGNEDDCDWLLGWMARAVQHPDLHAETAVVLRGPKGTGKGTLGKILRQLFRQHALHISNPAHFTGRFNGHLVDVLFLFVDEAFWAGDKSGEGTLKALVTEPTIAVEPKFVNMFQVRNRLKILMASNADWVVPATSDERRYFVLDVSECRRGDREYFNRLNEAIDGDELPAFLAYLLDFDLSGFDFRSPPHTQGLNQQKLAGADSVTSFWLDCLTNGEIIGSGETDWPEDVVAQVLHAAYVDHARDHGDRHPLPDQQMSRKLASMMPGKHLRRCRPHRPYGENARPTRFILPPLAECRAVFLEAMRIASYEWPEIDQ